MLPHGETLDLEPPAREIATRHRAEFADEAERYGDRGLEWCTYDMQWVLAWAAADAAGFDDLRKQVDWLAGILGARDYPVERLARSLEIAADVVPGLAPGLGGAAEALRRARSGAPGR